MSASSSTQSLCAKKSIAKKSIADLLHLSIPPTEGYDEGIIQKALDQIQSTELCKELQNNRKCLDKIQACKSFTCDPHIKEKLNDTISTCEHVIDKQLSDLSRKFLKLCKQFSILAQRVLGTLHELRAFLKMVNQCPIDSDLLEQVGDIYNYQDLHKVPLIDQLISIIGGARWISHDVFTFGIDTHNGLCTVTRRIDESLEMKLECSAGVIVSEIVPIPPPISMRKPKPIQSGSKRLKTPCRYLQDGKCKNGRRCRFTH
ncbi:MAG: hypothetical protein Homavirus25_3 [Homavirus sp.]|uniref:C3H1-type domain-containing protein n=1 Tax=Homavirus sp. TaxID=2487769 RepID=A0A3G5AAA8_9VIRU|nr:MAG: hypothetical protein Homavirus25_3 [Homavirus sp.]